jgi:Sel1 repeat
LDLELPAAVPNEASAAALRKAAQAATLCGDFATRARIIRALAERGDAGSQHILGAMYFYGGKHVSQDSISQDKSEGVKWFRRAANQGNNEAQGQLNMIYYGGDGVPKNYVEALKWLILEGTHDDAVVSLRDKMTPEQIAEAQRLASQWQPTPERVDLDLSSTLPTKTKPPWWQFWK